MLKKRRTDLEEKIRILEKQMGNGSMGKIADNLAQQHLVELYNQMVNINILFALRGLSRRIGELKDLVEGQGYY